MASYTGMPVRDRLAYTIAGEAGNQGRAGQDAVAHNILNRTYGFNGSFGKGTEGVIMRPGAYSMWNDETGYAGGAQGTSRGLVASQAGGKLDYYRGVADDAMAGKSADATGGSSHYYNPSISSPAWGIGGKGWTSTSTLGAHEFGVADGRSPYDGSNPDDPRSFKNSSLYGLPYDDFSKANVSEGLSTKGPYDFSSSDGKFSDLDNEPLTNDKAITDQKEKMAVETAPTGESEYVNGEKVSTPKAGTRGQEGSVPQAIVSAADQEAKTTAAAAKTTAEAAMNAAKTQATSDKSLQSSAQSWANNWAVRIFLFIVGAIFVGGALYLFGTGKMDIPKIPTGI